MNLNNEHCIAGLYLITDQGERLLERVEAALSGGVRVVQYRDKARSYAERAAIGSKLKRLCAARGVTFIVNDDLELAKALDADGVHLGQEDGDPSHARSVLGAGKIIGVSTHNLQEALAAQEAGADYIGFGSIYPTASKEVSIIQGADAAGAIKVRVRIPVVAIGGIDRDNAGALVDREIDAVAVISSVLSADDPALAAAEMALLFNRIKPHPRGMVLTVAGSDSGGGAGIQGDLKTIALLGSYGASAIAALTAQNSNGVSSVQAVPSSFLAAQLDAVLSDLPIDVVKVGMLFSPENAAVLAERIIAYGKRLVVVDPLMIAKGGAPLLEQQGLAVLKERLVPLSYLITPNVPEAEKLAGITIADVAGMEAAAVELRRMGAANVLVKGGHREGQEATDVLYDGKAFTRFACPRAETPHTHGTGCALASAISAFLARGEPLPIAVARAKRFITSAIGFALPLGKGHGAVNHYRAAVEENRFSRNTDQEWT